MKLKLDENFDVRCVPALIAAGHDVHTVRDEALCGSPDEVVFETCRREGRTLVTLDLDFSNPFRFSPAHTAGVVIVRPHRMVASAIQQTLLSVLPELAARNVEGSLWIIEPGRLRVYEPDEVAD